MVGAIVILLVLWVVFVTLMANVTAWAWNLIIFGLFSGPGPISAWHGLAIMVLISLLTGGFKATYKRN